MNFLHWNVVQVIAFGIIVAIWQRLGLSDRAVLIGNILAGVLLLIAMALSAGA